VDGFFVFITVLIEWLCCFEDLNYLDDIEYEGKTGCSAYDRAIPDGPRTELKRLRPMVKRAELKNKRLKRVLAFFNRVDSPAKEQTFTKTKRWK